MRLFYFILLVVLAWSVPVYASNDMESAPFIVGSGPVEGAYFKLGGVITSLMSAPLYRQRILGAEADKRPRSFRIQSTQGSEENLNGLENGTLKYAFVQEDVLARFISARQNTQGKAFSPKIVVEAYIEPLHFVVAGTSDQEKAFDHKKSTIALGPMSGGGFKSVQALLIDQGFPTENLKNVDFLAIRSQMQQKKIQAAAFIVGYPSAAVSDLLRGGVSKLIDAPLKTASSLWHETVIPKQTYHGQQKDIRTIGVKALLVTRADRPDTEVLDFLKIYWDKEIQKKLKCAWAGPEMIDISAHKKAEKHYHPAAVKFYSEFSEPQ